MTTWKQHQEAGNYTINKLIQFRDNEVELGKKWFGGKKHREKAEYYNNLINELPENPTGIDCALKIPDGVLAEMGW